MADLQRLEELAELLVGMLAGVAVKQSLRPPGWMQVVPIPALEGYDDLRLFVRVTADGRGLDLELCDYVGRQLKREFWHVAEGELR